MAERPQSKMAGENDEACLLFSPFTVKGVTFPSRFVLPPMQRGWGVEYAPTRQLNEFYRRSTQGGAGLVITEAAAINHPSATGHRAFVLMLREASAPAWKRCINEVHANGGRILIQLWHEGATRKENEGGLDPSYPTLSPSGLTRAGVPGGREATIEELRSIQDAYVEAALLAQKLGADGVEIHGAHGYLIDLFFWHETNLRTDIYGGRSLVERARYPTEIVQAIRAAVGEDFLVSFRFSQWKEVDYHGKNFSSPHELKGMLYMLRGAGVDIFHASARYFDRPEWPEIHSTRGLAGWTKSLTNAPVIAVGSVGINIDAMDTMYTDKAISCDVEGVIQVLKAKVSAAEFDMIAVGRSMLADQQWVNKAREQRYTEIELFRRDVQDAAVSTWDDATIRDAYYGKPLPQKQVASMY